MPAAAGEAVPRVKSVVVSKAGVIGNVSVNDSKRCSCPASGRPTRARASAQRKILKKMATSPAGVQGVMSCSSSSRAHRNNNSVRASAARRYDESVNVRPVGARACAGRNIGADVAVADRREVAKMSSSIEEDRRVRVTCRSTPREEGAGGHGSFRSPRFLSRMGTAWRVRR
jgi:hypothetical protein